MSPPIQPIIVSTETGLKEAISKLNKADTLYMDCEGDNLSRHGKLYTIQLYDGNPERLVYIIDMRSLPEALSLQVESEHDGASAGEVSACSVTLKDLIEHKRVVMFDPRSDVDALYHHYNVMPRYMVCLQLVEIAYRRRVDKRNKIWEPPYVSGLTKAITQYCRSSVTPEEKRIKARISDQLKNGLFKYEDFILSSSSPTDQDTVIYSCVDVLCLPELESKLWPQLCLGGQKWVLHHSMQRCHRAYEDITAEMIKSRSNTIPPRFDYNHVSLGRYPYR